MNLPYRDPQFLNSSKARGGLSSLSWLPVVAVVARALARAAFTLPETLDLGADSEALCGAGWQTCGRSGGALWARPSLWGSHPGCSRRLAGSLRLRAPGFCRKRRSRQGSSIAHVNAICLIASRGRISRRSREIPKTVKHPLVEFGYVPSHNQRTNRHFLGFAV